jgi:hypothetical protein
LVLDFDGRTCRLDYEPGESHSGLFGGNSNWRGTSLVSPELPRDRIVEAPSQLFRRGLDRRSADRIGQAGESRPSGYTAQVPSARPVSARREWPAAGARPKCRFQNDPAWRDSLLFYEYFHVETGEGLGASHQTGWTALAASLVAYRALAPGQSRKAAGASWRGFLDPCSPRSRWRSSPWIVSNHPEFVAIRARHFALSRYWERSVR